MNSFRAWFIGLVLASFAGLIALAQTPAAKSAASSKGISVLHPTAGNKVSGTVTFTPVADGVQVHAEIAGLTPGKHGFHVHEFGDCSAADASSAGAHFNPTNQPHAGPDAAARHEGDMGNVEADASGNAQAGLRRPSDFSRERCEIGDRPLGRSPRKTRRSEDSTIRRRRRSHRLWRNRLGERSVTRTLRFKCVVCAVLSAPVLEQALRISAEDSGRYRRFGRL